MTSRSLVFELVAMKRITHTPPVACSQEGIHRPAWPGQRALIAIGLAVLSVCVGIGYRSDQRRDAGRWVERLSWRTPDWPADKPIAKPAPIRVSPPVARWERLTVSPRVAEIAGPSRLWRETARRTLSATIGRGPVDAETWPGDRRPPQRDQLQATDESR